MGRRKIQMMMVEDSGSRQVTFTKRRNGVFNKADELATMCGADVAVVAFSPGGKPFSYGYPSVEAVANQFLNQQGTDPQNPSPTLNLDEAGRSVRIETMHEHLNELVGEIEYEKTRGEALTRKIDMTCMARKIKPVSELSLEELNDYQDRLEKIRDQIIRRVREMDALSSLLLLSKKDDAPTPAASKSSVVLDNDDEENRKLFWQ